MDKSVFENTLLKYIACINIILKKKTKEMLELDFVNLGCQVCVEQAPHIIK
jgi:hypothetical protein